MLDPETVKAKVAKIVREESKAANGKANGHGVNGHEEHVEADVSEEQREPFELDDELDNVVDDEEDEKEKRTVAQALVKIGMGAELFHSPEGDAFATVQVEARAETVKLRSVAFRGWLDRQFFLRTGRVAGAQAKQDAIGVLEAEAREARQELPVFVRTAEHEGAIYVDICDDERHIARVTAAGWELVKEAPVKFRRPKGALALPMPERGTKIEVLQDFVNVKSDAQRRLLVAWMIAALRPRGPYPILNLVGEQGSAKSTTTRVVRRLVDPNVSLLRTTPREERDLMVGAKNSHVLAYDNLSGMQPWLSDALCRIATGGGFSTRSLYTDDDETIFEAMRPILLNGIDEVAERPDLAERCLVVVLPPIPTSKRRDEKAFWAAFDAVSGGLVGALLDGIAGALSRVDSVEIEQKPRMADFAIWSTAAEPALGWGDGAFMAAYDENRADAVKAALEADPVAVGIRDLIALPKCGGRWEGTASELLEELRDLADEEAKRSKGWPRAANVLSNRVRRAGAFLRQVGIEATEERVGKLRRRVIRLEQRRGTSSASSASVTRPESLGFPADDAPEATGRPPSATVRGPSADDARHRDRPPTVRRNINDSTGADDADDADDGLRSSSQPGGGASSQAAADDLVDVTELL